MRPVITLTTDFGLKDPYVAEMKAVILGISPNTSIVDITHDIDKFDVKMAAYTLACASPYFPRGTVHVAIVDPHVGTKRRPILIQTQKEFYVGPDNGVLALAANNQGIEHVFEITNRRLMLSTISNTFHGRDIFAPVAAHLVGGTPPGEVGPEIRKIPTPSFARVVRRKNMLIGAVIHIDGFGNMITNFRQQKLDSLGIVETLKVKMKNRKLSLKLRRAYAEAKNKEALAIVGSHDFLEISVNQGDAGATFKARRGDKITLFKA